MSEQTGAVPTSAMPLVLGTPEDFATVRAWLTAIDYTERGVCARTGTTSIYAFRMRRDGREQGTALDDALDVAIRLLLDSEVVQADTAARLVPADVLAALERLGVLQATPGGMVATVLLYHTEGFWCVSDQTEPPPGRPALGADVVYPAVTANTRTFMEFLPRSPCDRWLEVCGGTGIAALVGARLARESWTADIAERSAIFADFNGRLNGLANFRSVAGDMYAPVGEAPFDRIVAHPPYVPAEKNRLIFRDGGSDGEELVRRVIVEGVPRLAPGGLLYVTCVASDRKGARLEQRIREWLGPQGDDVDILVIARLDADPVEYRMRSLLKVKQPLTDLEWVAQQAEALGIERSVYAHIYLRRHAVADRRGVAATSRRRVGSRSGQAEVAWALAVEDALGAPQVRRGLLDRVARVNPASVLLVQYAFTAEGLLPTEVTHSVEWPFVTAVRGPVWLGDLLARCDGTTPLKAVLDEFRATGLIDAAATDEQLGELVLMLAHGGTVEVDGLPPLPPAPVT